MPKIVDHDARRKQLAEATWRVIRQKGLEGVSVRNVAKEAGISLGSLRHYFSSQNELLAFSMKLIGDRVRERIQTLELSGDFRADLKRVIEETLPLDEERMSEAIIWFGFLSKSLVDSNLSHLAVEVNEALFELFHKLAEAVVRFGPERPNLDIEMEARRLHALVDGLVVHALTNPRSMTPEMIQQTVAYHLNGLLNP